LTNNNNYDIINLTQDKSKMLSKNKYKKRLGV